MKFRDDIDPENTWVVSDTHFGHENIVGYCARPVDHDQVILEQWRLTVPDDATVLHLGDLCYKGNAWFKNIVAPRLTGARKLLILGNHDGGRFSFYKACGFQIVKPFQIAYSTPQEGQWKDAGESQEHHISFSHYPWSTDEDGAQAMWDIRLHGHIHNNGYTRHGYVPFLRNHINVSVEQTRYRPVNLKLLLDGALLGKVPNA